MSIITLSGLDGSGKSTQIELLKDYLKSQDKTFFYFHAIDFSIGNKILGKKKSPSIPLFQRGRPDSLPFEKGELERDLDNSVTKANWLQIQLRKIALLIDIFRFRRLMKKLEVDYIISDRYFYDSVVNIEFLSSCHSCESRNPGINDSRFLTGSRVKPGMTILEKYIPKPDHAFFIKVSPEKIMQRERKPDQGMEYLAAKDKIFQEKIKDWDMIVIDGERHKDEIETAITSMIKKYE